MRHFIFRVFSLMRFMDLNLETVNCQGDLKTSVTQQSPQYCFLFFSYPIHIVESVSTDRASPSPSHIPLLHHCFQKEEESLFLKRLRKVLALAHCVFVSYRLEQTPQYKQDTKRIENNIVETTIMRKIFVTQVAIQMQKTP